MKTHNLIFTFRPFIWKASGAHTATLIEDECFSIERFFFPVINNSARELTQLFFLER